MDSGNMASEFLPFETGADEFPEMKGTNEWHHAMICKKFIIFVSILRNDTEK